MKHQRSVARRRVISRPPAVGFRNSFARRHFPPRPIGRECENNTNMLLDDGSVVQLP